MGKQPNYLINVHLNKNFTTKPGKSGYIHRDTREIERITKGTSGYAKHQGRFGDRRHGIRLLGSE
jgi:hypothetical protein